MSDSQQICVFNSGLIDLPVRSLANMKAWLARIDFKVVFVFAGEEMTIKNEFAMSLVPIIYKIRPQASGT